MSDSLQFFNGTGNTFYFFKIDDTNSLPVKTVDELRAYARQVCALKTRPVDGLVFYRVGNASTEMLIVNSDGSFAGTCGNALRCLGLALLQQKAWDGQKPITVNRLGLPFFKNETLSFGGDEKFVMANECFATLVEGKTLGSPTEANVSVKMGRVKNSRATAFNPPSSQIAIGIATSVFVELANPHWVFVMGSDTRKWSLEECAQFGVSAQTEWASQYGVPLSNIGLVWPTSQRDASAVLVVYERGAGLTQCCGSGACAAASVLHSLNPSQSEFRFQMPGGIVGVSIDDDGELILSGQVSTSF